MINLNFSYHEASCQFLCVNSGISAYIADNRSDKGDLDRIYIGLCREETDRMPLASSYL